MLVTRHSPHVTGRRPAAFTLIELLVVIAIIAILAGLAFPAVTGAIMSGKKSEVRSTANQIKLALSAYYAEYGTYPAVTNATPQFMRAMMGATNEPTVPNRRGIRFLELTDKWTNADGIVTPDRFLPTPVAFNIIVDTNYDGIIRVPSITNRTTLTNISGSVAVWVPDPTQSNKVIGTW
jgi:prepilin-type N-terminal cleavage/methylation domain-containing protein